MRLEPSYFLRKISGPSLDWAGFSPPGSPRSASPLGTSSAEGRNIPLFADRQFLRRFTFATIMRIGERLRGDQSTCMVILACALKTFFSLSFCSFFSHTGSLLQCCRTLQLPACGSIHIVLGCMHGCVFLGSLCSGMQLQTFPYLLVMFKYCI